MHIPSRVSILFLIGKFPSIGGVETVTVTLANEMALRGHQVHIASFEQEEIAVQPELSEHVCLHRLSKPVSRSISALRSLILSHHIDYIINQWCLPFHVTKACRDAMKGTRCRLVSVHHNAPNFNARISGALMAEKNPKD